MEQEYDFEIYTKNPVTGETGWDIKFIRVYAVDKDTAYELLLTVPDFDCVITKANGGRARRPQWVELEPREYGG